MPKKTKKKRTTYALKEIAGKLVEVHPELDDEDEPTEVTKLQQELEAKIEASCERMDGVAKKADRLRKSLADDRQSYPKMAAVLSDSASRPKE